MKKIGIDARLYSQTGVGTYLKNLLYYLEKKSNPGNLFYIYLNKKDFAKVTFRKKNFIKKKADYAWHSLAEQTGFCLQLYQDNLDLMHFTYFSYPVFYWKKFVATVHDVTPLLFKTGKASTKNPLIYQIKHFFFRLILGCQVRKAARIITPTETVKEQLSNIYGPKVAGKIKTIYEGINYQLINLKQSSPTPPRLRGASNETMKFNNFFIYVGNFYPHKNVERLVEAFSKIKGDTKLVLIGPKDYFQSRIAQSINRLDMKNKIIFFNNSSLSDLVYFYKNAKALIHPSLSEGFGLPLIEATYFNCPMIASNIKVFKELLGESYLPFNPFSAEDITEKINVFIGTKPTYDYSSIIKKYSFEKMAEETAKIYASESI